jgi:cytochrome c-type biogenesis protein CcmH
MRSRPDASGLSRAAGLLLALSFAVACDRNVEPFVPGEKPAAPQLSKIFPPGAERSKDAGPMGGPSGMPAAPGQRGAMPPPAPGEAAEVAVGPPIHGTIRLAPELESKLPAGAVLFLIARAGAGGPPTAVKRIPSPRFPLDFELGPDDRMIQQMPFAGPLRLTARVDGDGNATTRTPGDITGEAPQAVEPGAEGVVIVLDQPL